MFGILQHCQPRALRECQPSPYHLENIILIDYRLLEVTNAINFSYVSCSKNFPEKIDLKSTAVKSGNLTNAKAVFCSLGAG